MEDKSLHNVSKKAYMKYRGAEKRLVEDIIDEDGTIV